MPSHFVLKKQNRKQENITFNEVMNSSINKLGSTGKKNIVLTKTLVNLFFENLVSEIYYVVLYIRMVRFAINFLFLQVLKLFLTDHKDHNIFSIEHIFVK